VKIKVCGMTQMEQMYSLSELGVDFIGFIFYEKSPRYVFNQLTEKEIQKKKKEIKIIHGSFKKVGVFVNENYLKILRIVDECGLDFVQLHGNETPGYCDLLLPKVPVIKAFSIDEQTDIPVVIQPFEKSVSYFLFDTVTKKYGGSGKKFNWEKLSGLKMNKPFFLSGGIAPGDTGNLKNFMQAPVAKNLFAFDINSKFEITPGVKDMNKIDNFCKEMNLGKYKGF
jgi:phosphoribosylanthranilate isomerase